MQLSTKFLTVLFSTFDTSNDPTWHYKIIEAQLNARHLIIFGNVQCLYVFTYVLYEIDGNKVTYKTKKNLTDEYSEIEGEFEVGRFLKKIRIVSILLLHNKLIENQIGL